MGGRSHVSTLCCALLLAGRYWNPAQLAGNEWRRLLRTATCIRESWTAQLAFDEQHLYLAARGFGTTPMLNRAADKQLILQGGDAFDLNLGLDAKADPKRAEAVPGDVRLVLSLVNDQPVAMLLSPARPRRIGIGSHVHLIRRAGADG